MKPAFNARGNFCIVHKELLDKASAILGFKVSLIEADFRCRFSHTPGRIMTIDPADAYPDETTDDRELIHMLVYGDHATDFIEYNGYLTIPEELEELVTDTMYDASIELTNKPEPKDYDL